MENLWNEYSPLIIEYGTGLIYAILVLVIGLYIVSLITKSAKKLMMKGALDISLVPFLTSLINIGLKILVVISALSMLGIEMTSFIALLGAAGLAVGMALSGTLQNFAGGVIILILKPFKVGDVIEAQGYIGSVKEILIFNTILTTFDNKSIILPNGSLATGSMVNYTSQETRRVDWKFGIAYGDDSDHAKKVMMDLITADERVLQDPPPFVALSELGDSSVNFVVRAWVNAGDYWPVFFEMNEKVYKTFSKEGLHIPFPQMDIHLDK
ncbi:MAG: mechanosensitive ion channel [Bacteroidales bacterium]|nr:mechanosensitive ion channel [Bacteroidales bacterium]